MPYDVFISYASEDIAFAQELNDRLVKEGFKVWFDKVRLTPGFDWYKEIEQGCENSRVLLPVMTPRWKISEWTKYETYGAEFIIPLLFEGALEKVLTPPLLRFQGDAIDITIKDNSLHWQKLFDSIRNVLLFPHLETKDQRIANLRFSHNPNFVGREALLDQIHEKLFANPTTALTQGHIQAVTALGGVGKSTIAHEYAEKFWRCYRQIFWLSCKAGIVTELSQIFSLLFPERTFVGQTDEEKARSVFYELKRPDAPLRLIIFDDAIDENTILGWLPKTGNCHSIITSRFTGWQTGIEQTPVWVLDKKPARQLLLRRSGLSEESLDEDEIVACDAMASQLGYLPLALEQAAAYIWNQNRGQIKGFAFRKYLSFYAEAENERRLLAKKSSKGSTEYPDAVFNTWRTTIDQLPSGARAILRLASFMAPTPIPFEMFLKGASKIAEMALTFEFIHDVSPEPNEFEIREWKEALLRYSMIKVEENDTFSIHMLVQAVERQNSSINEIKASLRLSIDLVVLYGPESANDPVNWYIWNVLYPHGEILLNHCKKLSIIDYDLFLLLRLDEYNFGKFKFTESVKYSKELLNLTGEKYGMNSTKYAKRLINHGESLRKLQLYVEAEKCFHQSLDIRKTNLGQKHIDVATSLNYLGLAIEDLSDLSKAESYYMEGKEICKEINDIENDTYLKLIQNLGRCLFYKGKYEDSELLFQEALEIGVRINGQEYLLTLYSLEWIGAIKLKQGNLVESVNLFNKVLLSFQNLWGEDHPETFNCMSVLASILMQKGDFAASEIYYKRVLALKERILGYNNPDTITSLKNYINLLEKTNRHSEARQYRINYIDRSLSVSNNDPLKLRELAGEYYNNGDYDQTESILRKVLNLGFEIPGNHCHLTRIYILTDRLSEAKKNVEQAWVHRSEAPVYVVARILWFKITLVYLGKSSPNNFFSQLKTILQKEDAYMEWTMHPVLDHIKPKLTAPQHSLLTALVAAMSDKQNLEKLNHFEEWRDAKPEEIE